MRILIRERKKGRTQEQAAAEAALGGHDLGEWQQTEGPGLVGYQARCKRCKKTTWASRLAVYSVLADVCPGEGG